MALGVSTLQGTRINGSWPGGRPPGLQLLEQDMIVYHPVYGRVETTGKSSGNFTEVRGVSGRVPGGVDKIMVGARVLSGTPHTGKPILVIDTKKKQTKKN